jgi:hypothetical protein
MRSPFSSLFMPFPKGWLQSTFIFKYKMWQCFKHFIYTSPSIQISLSFMKKSHASSRHLYMLVGILSIFNMPCYQIKVENANFFLPNQFYLIL